MPMMKVKGYIPDSQIPPGVQKNLNQVIPFINVHKTFKAAASSTAQDGTDYDIPNEPPAYDQGDMGSCHDDKTEVLTDQGWKLFASLSGAERLATVDPKTAALSFEHPTALIRFPYEGELICAETQTLNFRVTPNHNMLVRPWNEKSRTLSDEYQLIPAEKLGWYVGLLNNVGWEGEATASEYVLPGVDHKHKPQREPRAVPMAAWMRFLGIYLAEGTMLKQYDTPRYVIQIAASKAREKAFVRQVLKDIGVHALEFADRFTFSSRQVYEAMTSLGLKGVKAGDKFVPRFVFSQSAAMIREFLAGHFAGDGCEQYGMQSHYTGSAQLADDLQLLGFLSGAESHIGVREARSSMTSDGRTIIGHLPEHRVAMCRRKNLSIERKDQVFRTHYKGEVFCAEVPTHHTLVTRREGKVLISGNCVLNSSTGALNIVLAVEAQTTMMLSRLFLYWLCRYAMGTLDQDSGTYTHLAVDRIGKIGVCQETFWQYQDSNLYVPPPPECYPAASDNKATAWFNITDPAAGTSGPTRLDQIETAIRSNHPVIFGTPCDGTIQSYIAGQVLGIPNVNALIGGHSMCVTGVHYLDGARVWRIRNSWSTSYGDDGHLLISDDWMGWVSLTDLWLLTRMDPLLF